MSRALLSVAIAVAGLLVASDPASAFDGYRADFTPTATCAPCHDDTSRFPAAARPYEEWLATAHGAEVQTAAIARGPGCAVCHVGNYDPAKHVPAAAGGPYPSALTDGDDAFSETGVGCSACHVEQVTTHAAADALLASPDVCGQCHARYSTTVATYPAWTWPAGAPSPRPTEVRLQGTLGDFNPVGSLGDRVWIEPSPLARFLTVPAAGAPQLGRVWPSGQMASAHGEGAGQYSEWVREGHAGALEQLRAVGQAANPRCLECHSTDFRLANEAEEPIDPGAARYGVTCVGCHNPHERGAQSSVWNDGKNPQLIAAREDLCVECHNAGLGTRSDGTPGVARAGRRLHHPVREMMDGTGAIGVTTTGPGVHKGACVQCHMPPTGYEHDGAIGTAGNHLFAVITPEQAATTTLDFGAYGVRPMPYSACTTCHSRPGDAPARWLQDTITDRQAAMTSWIERVTRTLAAAARSFGYGGTGDAAAVAAANAALNREPASKWTAKERAFQRAFTNLSFVESEGSLGIHNWTYARVVVLTALKQAEAAR